VTRSVPIVRRHRVALIPEHPPRKLRVSVVSRCPELRPMPMRRRQPLGVAVIAYPSRVMPVANASAGRASSPWASCHLTPFAVRGLPRKRQLGTVGFKGGA
jgi:hypothetical protein